MLDAIWLIYCILLGLLGIYGAHRLCLTVRYLYGCMGTATGSGATQADPEEPVMWPAEVPCVTVQLPLFNERYVAERVIDAAAALDWPQERLEIQICDDSTDDTAALCQAKASALRKAGYRVQYLHRCDRTGFKAGALAAATEQAAGELILILDADFVPAPRLLRDLAWHFRDPTVGMVQARWEHLNRGHSALTEVQALLLDGHFVIEQGVRAHTGRFFNFNGTAGLWRRRAIEQAGGWHSDTLTEDLDLSYRALLCGWRFVYAQDCAVPAELPVDMNGFKSQQFRWAKGSVQVARKLLGMVWRASLPLGLKIEAFFHLTQNIPYLLTWLLIVLAVPALVLRPAAPGEALWLHVPALLWAAVTLGAYLCTAQRALGKGTLRALVRLPIAVALTAAISVNQARAVLEGALGHSSEFVRTPKHGITDQGNHWLQARGARGFVPRYRGLRDLIPIGEIALAFYLLGAVAMALMGLSEPGSALPNWALAPPFVLLGTGFGYVGIRSAFRR